MSLDLLPGIAQEVEVRKIRSPRYSLRVEYGQMDELLLSIAQKGLVQPIVVRPIEENDLFEVVAGNRRLRACKILRVKKIPCYIMNLDDKEAFEMSLVENLQRKTLNPLEEAKAFKIYVTEFGYGSETDLAKRVGKSPSYVSRRIGLLKLPKKVQMQLLRGARLGLTQELDSLDDNEKKIIAGFIAESKLIDRSEVRQIVRLVKEDRGNELKDFSPSFYVAREARQHSLSRTIGKFIASLEICMMRLDELVNSLDEEEWVVRDILLQQRSSIHNQIDTLMKLKRKVQHELPPTLLEGRHHSYVRRDATLTAAQQQLEEL
jgi:ParB family transcriptional regulator, chromosome partitioning protein